MFSFIFTCNHCNKNNETRLPDLPCAPCRKKRSQEAAEACRRTPTSSRMTGAGLAMAAIASLALLTTAPSMAVEAKEAAAVVNGGIMGHSSSPLRSRRMSPSKYHRGEKTRLLEELFGGHDKEDHEHEGMTIDVDSALIAASSNASDGGRDEDVHNDDHDHDEGEHREDNISLSTSTEDEEHHDHDEEHNHEEDFHAVDEEHHDHDEHGHDNHGHDEHDEFHTETSILHDEEEQAKPWGYVILATLLVNITSLSGLLLLLIPAIHRGYLTLQGSNDTSAADAKRGRLFDICVPAFAVGALMSTAFFLVMPEALHLIEGKHSDHGDEHLDHRRFLMQEDGHDDHDDHGDHSGEGYDSHSDHSGHDDSSESQVAAKFGVAVLGGFLLPMLFGMAFHRHGPTSDDSNEHVGDSPRLLKVADGIDDTEDAGASRKLSVVTGEDEGCDCCTKESKKDVETGVVVREVSGDDRPLPETIILDSDKDGGTPPHLHPPQARQEEAQPQQQSQPLPAKVQIDYRLIASVIVGDAFCNFVDGLFVGAAFLGCSWATTASILMVTVFHELPQEMADFLLLTRYAGLSTMLACVVNFASGLVVMLGGIVVLATTTSDEIVGVILAMAGGCYINIAACETVPRMEKHVRSFGDRASMVFSFILGTIPIGLVLLKHEHC